VALSGFPVKQQSGVLRIGEYGEKGVEVLAERLLRGVNDLACPGRRRSPGRSGDLAVAMAETLPKLPIIFVSKQKTGPPTTTVTASGPDFGQS
jgi:hypothetical protein